MGSLDTLCDLLVSILDGPEVVWEPLEHVEEIPAGEEIVSFILGKGDRLGPILLKDLISLYTWVFDSERVVLTGVALVKVGI